MGTSQAFQDKIIETNNENIHNEVAIAIGDTSGVEQNCDSRHSLDEAENSIPTSQDNGESVRVDNSKKGQMLELIVENLLARQSDKIELSNSSESPSVHMKDRNMQDTISLASASSSGSLSSASSVCSNSKVNVKVFSPANENADSQYQNQSQSHHRIRRVPSTANPKHRVPTLGRTQRSKSQPHLNIPTIQSQRRNSSPNPLSFQGGIPNVHGTPLIGSKNHLPNVSQLLQHLHQSQQINQGQSTAQGVNSQHQQQSRHAVQQQQQQIIYLQIPQPPQAQAYDSQALQSQISSQLQQLVPQIYSLLLNQITSPTLGSSSKSSSNQNSHKQSESIHPNFSGEVQSQRVTNQILEQNSTPVKSSNRQKSSSQSNQPKRSKSNVGVKPTVNNPSVETINETEDISKYIQMESLSQILQQIPSHILQQNQNSSKASYIEIQQLPGCPKITIPITQELLNQCQQYQQQRDVEYVPYHPSLETILEESLSVKHLKMNTFPKTKIIACILTVLCVIVVVLLAGDKTIAVVVVAVIFIIFLLASIFYLYVNSTKSSSRSPFSQSDSQRIQVTGLSSTCDKASMQV